MRELARTPAPFAPRNEAGATITEYALLLALVLIVALAGMRAFGAGANDSLNRSGSSVSAAR